MHFQKGDAARLDFAGDTFNGAMSNLTLGQSQNGREPEGSCTGGFTGVKPGGSFVRVDYFDDERYYGNKTEFERFLRGPKSVTFRIPTASRLDCNTSPVETPKNIR